VSISFVRMTNYVPSEEQPEPPPAWIRGDCPRCGAPVVRNLVWDGGQYVHLLECWRALEGEAACDYTARLNALGMAAAP
jgi:hypothetical protein